MREHFMTWGANADSIADTMAPRACYVKDGTGARVVVLITAGAIGRGEMPPGFQRFLTEAELESEGVLMLDPQRDGELRNKLFAACRSAGKADTFLVVTPKTT